MSEMDCCGVWLRFEVLGFCVGGGCWSLAYPSGDKSFLTGAGEHFFGVWFLITALGCCVVCGMHGTASGENCEGCTMEAGQGEARRLEGIRGDGE